MAADQTIPSPVEVDISSFGPFSASDIVQFNTIEISSAVFVDLSEFYGGGGGGGPVVTRPSSGFIYPRGDC